ncbi:high mobility group protein HMGI-C-like isoform X2 [Xyrauchen texanus]|uniref:high mobility group protein HMGI-C-like isoform X2 n=1 Tax=Xyrauchen texanus TaxID=154827 RepID=UPI002242A6F2|nr:high mobility group protein HMGI-C-like isoform X2 [Xyrauchen texanus]
MSCSGCVFMCVGMDVEETGAGHMEAAEEAPAPKRSRGRPRKQPQKSDEILAPRRPRGRPRGSKNKDQRVTTKPQKTINQEEQQPSHPEVEGAESTEDLPTQTPPSELHQQDSG